MPPDKEAITKTDLDVIGGELKLLRQLMENELRHHAEDISGLRDWRDQFVAEGGPWRAMDKRVGDLEYLARAAKWVAGILAPIAVWASIEIVKALITWAQQGGP